MESTAAGRSDAPLPPRRSRRVKTTTSSSRASPESNKRRPHAHITKRGRGRKRPHHAVRPCSSSHPPPWGGRAHARLRRRRSVPAKMSTLADHFHFLPPALRSRSRSRPAIWLRSQRNVRGSSGALAPASPPVIGGRSARAPHSPAAALLFLIITGGTGLILTMARWG